MIPTKNRRLKAMKFPKNIERLYKEGKCRECAVVVTRMDFARILGKFTKVKIQYETSKLSKGKMVAETAMYSKTKQKTNENGIVNKKSYNNYSKDNKSRLSREKDTLTSHSVNSVLKENNRLQKALTKDKNLKYNNNVPVNSKLKQYGIIFTNPITNHKNDVSKISLVELITSIDNSVLPSEEWCIDYFPKNDEPKDDKVYDRIAAELEDLMNNGKSETKVTDKSDDFPSIMDILNDNTVPMNKSVDENSSTDLESNDVESILLGKPNLSKTLEPTSMDIDNTDVSNLLADVEQFNAIQPVNSIDTSVTEACVVDDINNPHSPSILDEALQKGIEEHLPPGITTSNCEEVPVVKPINEKATENKIIDMPKTMELDTNEVIKPNENDIQMTLASKAEIITEIVFKKTLNGQCYKSVTCPKSLKYQVELDGKSVEFVGAPKLISNLEDLRILLQIVNESDLKSFYVLQ